MLYSIITLYVGCGILRSVWIELALSGVQWRAFVYGDLNLKALFIARVKEWDAKYWCAVNVRHGPG
jgi:hypothetical protein